MTERTMAEFTTAVWTTMALVVLVYLIAYLYRDRQYVGSLRYSFCAALVVIIFTSVVVRSYELLWFTFTNRGQSVQFLKDIFAVRLTAVAIGSLGLVWLLWLIMPERNRPLMVVLSTAVALIAAVVFA